jgi:hypothetical protein
VVDFVFPTGKEGWVSGIRGTVTGVKRWSETRVQSRGSPTNVMTSISSHVTDRGEFWIKSQAGKEVQIRHPLPVNDGHEFILVSGGLAGTSNGKNLYWKNLTTGQEGFFKGNAEFSMILTESEQKLGKKIWYIINILVFLAALDYVVKDGQGGTLLLAGIAAITINLWVAKILAGPFQKRAANRRGIILENQIKELMAQNAIV